MWRRCLLSGMAVWLAAATPALAFIAYVSNEKSNTVSVIDTDKWAVTNTIKVGQRPRGIEFTRDGKFVLVAVGDDDKIEVIDAATQQVVDSLPSGPDPELFTQDAAGKILYVANENDNTVTIIDLEKRVRVGDIQVGVEPEGMAHQPGRQDPDQYLRDHQHGAFHRHRDAPDRRQCAGRCAAALCRVQARQLRIVGVVGDRRHRVDHRSRQTHRLPARSASTFPACGARRSSRSASASPRTARPLSLRLAPPTALRSSMPPPIRSPNIFWSASGSGTWPSPRTKNICW